MRLHRGTITQASAAGTKVRIPATWPGVDMPVQETLVELTEGDLVLVAEPEPDELVVIGIRTAL